MGTVVATVDMMVAVVGTAVMAGQTVVSAALEGWVGWGANPTSMAAKGGAPEAQAVMARKVGGVMVVRGCV